MSAIPDKIGRYRIETVLGRGAMGVIYRAHDPEIDRPVAIKLIRAEAPARAHDVRHLTSGGRPLPVVSMGSWNAWKELARYVGPIARVLLKPMAADLWQQIECEGDRRAFLSGRRTEPEPANTRWPACWSHGPHCPGSHWTSRLGAPRVSATSDRLSAKSACLA